MWSISMDMVVPDLLWLLFQLIVKDGSHPAYLDDPALWNAKLIAFIQKVVQ